MFAEIHDYFEKVKEELETRFDSDRKALVADIRTSVTQAKAAALQEVAALSPDVQAAVQKAINELEQAVLAAIAAHVI